MHMLVIITLWVSPTVAVTLPDTHQEILLNPSDPTQLQATQRQTRAGSTRVQLEGGQTGPYANVLRALASDYPCSTGFAGHKYFSKQPHTFFWLRSQQLQAIIFNLVGILKFS
jgi:hypothetical protein